MRRGELARQQEGFLGVESARGADGFCITVSYWASEAAIAAWPAHAAHAQVHAHCRAAWYTPFALRVAQVERADGGSHARRPGSEGNAPGDNATMPTPAAGLR
jgi:heme-degrading monooxygenase HmoA